MAAEGDWKMVAAEATGERVALPPPCWFRAVDEVFRGILGAAAVGVDCCGGKPTPELPLGEDAGLFVEAIVQLLHSPATGTSVAAAAAPFLGHARSAREREERQAELDTGLVLWVREITQQKSNSDRP